jgi:hypothetical protein
MRRECLKFKNGKEETVTVASRFIDWAGEPSVTLLLGSHGRTLVARQFIFQIAIKVLAFSASGQFK